VYASQDDSFGISSRFPMIGRGRGPPGHALLRRRSRMAEIANAKDKRTSKSTMVIRESIDPLLEWRRRAEGDAGGLLLLASDYIKVITMSSSLRATSPMSGRHRDKEGQSRGHRTISCDAEISPSVENWTITCVTLVLPSVRDASRNLMRTSHGRSHFFR
jgi:hypothetical protein